MGARFQNFVARHVVMTVPDEMDACQECVQVTCDAARFKTCAYRLERLASIQQAREESQARMVPLELDPEPIVEA